MPGGKSANVKDEKQYEALKDKGMSKERAAKIASSPDASRHGGEQSGTAATAVRAAPRPRRRRPAARAARPATSPSAHRAPDEGGGRRVRSGHAVGRRPSRRSEGGHHEAVDEEPAGEVLTSSITREAVDDLELVEGKQVIVLIKSTEVGLAVE